MVIDLPVKVALSKTLDSLLIHLTSQVSRNSYSSTHQYLSKQIISTRLYVLPGITAKLFTPLLFSPTAKSTFAVLLCPYATLGSYLPSPLNVPSGMPLLG
jgi:hypothetical protein